MSKNFLLLTSYFLLITSYFSPALAQALRGVVRNPGNVAADHQQALKMPGKYDRGIIPSL
jgi:hypothetical protein